VPKQHIDAGVVAAVPSVVDWGLVGTVVVPLHVHVLAVVDDWDCIGIDVVLLLAGQSCLLRIPRAVVADAVEAVDSQIVVEAPASEADAAPFVELYGNCILHSSDARTDKVEVHYLMAV
jgi:hypothetical protein